jgi:hypothetical protein
VTTFANGRLSEIKFYPVTIESSTNPTDGLPHPPTLEQARRILDRLKQRSAIFGTVVTVEGDVGFIRLPDSAKQ